MFNVPRSKTWQAYVVAGVLLSTPAAALADDLPAPGLYSMTTTVSSEQLPISRTQESEQCIRENQFMRDPDSWMQKQRGQDCQIIEYEVSGGKIRMQLDCTIDAGGKALITGEGSYTTSGFELTNTMKMEASGMAVEINTAVTGTRKGGC